MIIEFWEEIAYAKGSPTARPFVQANARAISESTPPLPQQEAEGGLAYQFPESNPSGES